MARSRSRTRTRGPGVGGELGEVVSQVAEKYGEHVMHLASRKPAFKHIPTGIFTLDMASFGGIPESLVTLVYGWEGSGKSTLVLRAIAQAQRKYPDKRAVLVDIEGTYDPVWGALHGLYLAGERMLGIDRLDRSKMGALEKWGRGILTFHLVCLAWVFFRAPSASYAFTLIGRVFSFAPGQGISSTPLFVLLLIVAVQIAKSRVDFGGQALRFPNLVRWGVYACTALLVLALAGGRSPEFIYFQF